MEPTEVHEHKWIPGQGYYISQIGGEISREIRYSRCEICGLNAIVEYPGMFGPPEPTIFIPEREPDMWTNNNQELEDHWRPEQTLQALCRSTETPPSQAVEEKPAVKCPVCGSSEHVTLIIPMYSVPNLQSHEVYECETCGEFAKYIT